jgi:hypothetical protein
MAVTIPTWAVNAFKDSVRHVLQETDFLFSGAVDIEVQEKEYDSYDYLGAVDFRDTESRHQDTVLDEAEYLRRWCFTTERTYATLLDDKDIMNMLTSPMSKLVKAVVNGYNRKRNYVCATRFFSDVRTGKTPDSGTTSWSTDTQVAVTFGNGSTAARLTLKKIIEANRIADYYKWPVEGRYFGITSQQKSDLLNMSQIQSSDYNGVRALINGQVDTWLGFHFVQCEDFTTDSSDYRECPFWHRDGFLFAEGRRLDIDISPRADKNNSLQLLAKADMGSIRMEEKAVGKVLCSEA